MTIERERDWKRDYLMKTFRRINRKDIENYIVNAIWNRLDDLDIQPVTQQYVKRSDDRYALLDLYFPQLNIGIEVDEPYHDGIDQADRNREKTMEEMLSSFVETNDFVLMRISAEEGVGIESIHNQIDGAVRAVKARQQERNYPVWNPDIPASTIAIGNGRICVSDGLGYKTITDICRCFGRQYKMMQRCFIKIGHGYRLWCPKLAVMKKDAKTAASRGWLNELSDDWASISESKEGLVESQREAPSNEPRITFAQCSDALGFLRYRFIGVYQYDPYASDHSRRVYSRTADELDINDWKS